MSENVNVDTGPMGLTEVAVNPKANGKINIFDLENMMDDKPVEIPEEFKKASKVNQETKQKFEANKPPVKTKEKPVKKVEETDELGLDDDAEEFLESLDEDESDKKSSKKTGLELLDDDYENEESSEETTEEVEETPEEITSLELSKLEEKVLKQLYKVPLEGGQTEEVSLQNLINGYGKNKGGDKKLQEAAEMKKQLNELVTKLTDKDERTDILERLIAKSGDDYHEFIENEHARLLKFSMLDDDQKERLIKERSDAKELKLFRQERESIDKQQKEKEQSDYMNTLYNNIGTAIQEDPLLLKMQQGLSDSNKTYIINKFEAFVKLIDQKKAEDPKFDIGYKQIADLVKEEIRKDIKNAPKLPDEEMEKLSEDQLRTLGKSKKTPVKVEKKTIPGVQKSNGTSNKQVKKSTKQQSTWDFIRSFE